MENAPAASEEVKLSPEVADVFGTKVAPETKSDAPTSTPKAEDKKEEATKPEQPVEKKDGEAPSKEESQPKVFKVAGKEYDSIEKAIEAVNSIAGKNTRLSGDLARTESERAKAIEENAKLQAILKDFQDANDAWQKYYDGEGEKPTLSKTEIKQQAQEAIAEWQSKQKEEERKTLYQSQIDAIFKEPDINDVLPYFEDLVNEYGDNPKVEPKKLYERARLLFKGEKTKDLDSIDAEVERRVQQRIQKELALKASGNTGSDTPSLKSKEDVSPIIADIFKR